METLQQLWISEGVQTDGALQLVNQLLQSFISYTFRLSHGSTRKELLMFSCKNKMHSDWPSPF